MNNVPGRDGSKELKGMDAPGTVRLCENCHSERSEESRTAQNTDPSHLLRMTKSKKGAFSHNLPSPVHFSAFSSALKKGWGFPAFFDQLRVIVFCRKLSGFFDFNLSRFMMIYHKCDA